MKKTKTSPLPLGAGAVRVASGWKSLSEHDLVKDFPVSSAPLALNRALAPPRLQVSLLTAPAEKAPEAQLIAVYEAMRARSEGVRLKERGTFMFDDGVTGSFLAMEVEPLPGMRATQLHAARSEGGRTLHLLANVPATAPAAAVAEATQVLKSFTPRR